MQNGHILSRLSALGLVLAVLLVGCSLGTQDGANTPSTGVVATAGSTVAASAAPSSGSGAVGQSVAVTPTGGVRAVPTAGRAGTGTAGTGPATGVGTPGTSAAMAPSSLPDIIGVTKQVRPATVLVQNLGGAGGGAVPGQGGTGGDIPQGAGTGFIYDPAGYIITNNHVVAGAQRLRVVLPPPDNRAFDARLIGADPLTDIALLKIDAPDLPIVPLGDSSALQAGQWVVAIGNALALPGGPTVTAGVVSALGRDIAEPGGSPGEAGPTLYDLIQTDAAINPGNSGGPLVNLRGEVVGVNTLGASGANTIGFAIAIDTVEPLIAQLRRTGKIARGYLGVYSATVTPAVANALGLSRDSGVFVRDLIAGGPAAQAGVQQGDVIVGLGGRPIAGQGDLQAALTRHFRPGETVEVRLIRNGTEQTVRVTLGDRPTQ